MKLVVVEHRRIEEVSPPARGRGLKLRSGRCVEGDGLVAPRAGARIETTLTKNKRKSYIVAPRAGARIETLITNLGTGRLHVAPRAGARIETWPAFPGEQPFPSRPPRGGAD